MADADGGAQALVGATETSRDGSDDEIVWARPSQRKKTQRRRPQEPDEAALSTSPAGPGAAIVCLCCQAQVAYTGFSNRGKTIRWKEHTSSRGGSDY